MQDEQQRIELREIHVRPAEEEQDEDAAAGGQEETVILERRLSLSYNPWQRPNALLSTQAYSRHLGLRKVDVLEYFSKAARVKVRSVGTDVQVTDLSDNPLFDIWYQMKCTNRVWTLEAYSWPLLTISEQLSLCDPFYSETLIGVSDHRGNYFGSIGCVQPYALHNAENKPIARLVRHYEEKQPAALESIRCVGHDDVVASSSSAGEEEEYDKPLPLLAEGSEGERTMRLSCVSEANSVCIASLDTRGVLEFDHSVNLHTKLLILLAIVRIVGLESSPFSLGCSLLKMFIGCCFRGY